MRRANGSGSIFKIKGAKRRKPWRVRITKGWDIIPATGKCRQIVVTLGYYATRQEAEAALVAYHECPYDIKEKDITFEEAYKQWSEGYFEKLSGDSSKRTIICAFRYCHPIYRMRMRDIRTYHLQECMEHAYIISDRGKDKGQKRMATANVKSRMKSLFNMMFDWCYARDIVDKNYARTFGIDKDIRIEQKRNA